MVGKRKKLCCSCPQNRELCHGKNVTEEDLEVTKMSLKSVANRNWHSWSHFPPQKGNPDRSLLRDWGWVKKPRICNAKPLLKWLLSCWGHSLSPRSKGMKIFETSNLLGCPPGLHWNDIFPASHHSSLLTSWKTVLLWITSISQETIPFDILKYWWKNPGNNPIFSLTQTQKQPENYYQVLFEILPNYCWEGRYFVLLLAVSWYTCNILLFFTSKENVYWMFPWVEHFFIRLLVIFYSFHIVMKKFLC